MTKAELLEQMKDAPDDAEVTVFVFDQSHPVSYAYYIVDDPDEKTDIVLGLW